MKERGVLGKILIVLLLFWYSKKLIKTINKI